MVALGDAEPDHAIVFVEGRILEGMRRLEAVFALQVFPSREMSTLKTLRLQF